MLPLYEYNKQVDATLITLTKRHSVKWVLSEMPSAMKTISIYPLSVAEIIAMNLAHWWASVPVSSTPEMTSLAISGGQQIEFEVSAAVFSKYVWATTAQPIGKMLSVLERLFHVR